MTETTYSFRFNLEGGKHIEFDLSKKKFDKLSKICEKKFPEKNWKIKRLTAIKA